VTVESHGASRAKSYQRQLPLPMIYDEVFADGRSYDVYIFAGCISI